MGKKSTTTVECQSGEFTKKILIDNFEIQNIENTDENTLFEEVQLTSE